MEGAILAGRIRFFKDDLEGALGPRLGTDAVSLTPGPEADALVLGYVRERLRMTAGGQALEPRVLASGYDELDREPVWWITLEYRAGGPIDELEVRNTLLFERFDDQRNVFKFVRFPDETQRTVYFAHGEEERRVRF